MKKLLYPLACTLTAFLILYSCSAEEEDSTPPPSVVKPTTPEPEPEPEVSQYTLTVTAGEGGTVSTEGGTYDEGTDITITATPDDGYVFLKWNNDNYKSEINITINNDIEIEAIFIKKELNGWYSIFRIDNQIIDVLDYYETTLHYKLFYFESNVLKNMADIKDVKEYWYVETNQKAIVKTGNTESFESEYFNRENAGLPGNFIESYSHNSNGIYNLIIQRVSNIGIIGNSISTWSPENWLAVPFDYDNYPKMETIRSEVGFLSDQNYINRDFSNINSIIKMFFEDIERYGGTSTFKAEEVEVVWINYGGYGAGGGGSCDIPTIYLDPFWFEEALKGKFYDKKNHELGVIYHELGHAVFGLDHLCESGHIMTGWHGARDGTECRGDKDVTNVSDLISIAHLEYDHENKIKSWKRAVEDMVTLENQFPYECLNENYISNIEIEDPVALIGFYNREPITNDWHKVQISLTNNQLLWKNQAGINWLLYIRNGELWTGSDCPYGEQKLGLKGENDIIIEIVFNGEKYIRKN